MSQAGAPAPSPSEAALHAAAITAPIAAAAHTDLSNALTTPMRTFAHEATDPAAEARVKALPAVVYRDRAEFDRKRAQLIAGGAEKLQVIADFDRTLSAFVTSAGVMCRASHELLESCVGFDQTTFRPQMDAINKKYFALEVSHEITEEQRAAYMMEWWQQAHELLLQQHIRQSTIHGAIRTSIADGSLELRRGAPDFLRLLESASIPCLVFSAGLAETIRCTLEETRLMLPNMHLIGNQTYFDSDGVLARFSEDVITSSNKNYGAHVRSMEPDYDARSRHRRHVILIGDNIGDANMANGLEGVECLLKIGLLHEKVDQRLEQFRAAFDVVLLHDADFGWMHHLVEAIVKGK